MRRKRIGSEQKIPLRLEESCDQTRRPNGVAPASCRPAFFLSYSWLAGWKPALPDAEKTCGGKRWEIRPNKKIRANRLHARLALSD